MSLVDASEFKKSENPIERAIAKKYLADFESDCRDDFCRGRKEMAETRRRYELEVRAFSKEEVIACERKHGFRWTA